MEGVPTTPKDVIDWMLAAAIIKSLSGIKKDKACASLQKTVAQTRLSCYD